MMQARTVRPLLFAALMLASSAIVGQANAQQAYVTIAPPAPRFEAPPPPPPRHMRGHTAWRPGYWQWANGRYVWVAGHYVRAPRHGAEWVPGHWDQRRRGWVWVRGHWN